MEGRRNQAALTLVELTLAGHQALAEKQLERHVVGALHVALGVVDEHAANVVRVVEQVRPADEREPHIRDIAVSRALEHEIERPAPQVEQASQDRQALRPRWPCDGRHGKFSDYLSYRVPHDEEGGELHQGGAPGRGLPWCRFCATGDRML